MKISILLPTLGERESELKRLLDSLEKQIYKNFEVVVVSQSNHDKVKKILDLYNNLKIKHITLNRKGLSYARNEGLSECSGDIVLLSDDDCWYHENSMEIIKTEIEKNNADFLFTQIYDLDNNQSYKNYPKSEIEIESRYALLSKSSIEIAFKSKSIEYKFDEDFGVGGLYACGEEVDFLINNFTNSKKFLYIPKVTVFHPKKNIKDERRIVAKGALYAKHFNILFSILVLFRDLLMKRQNNFKLFFKGYFEYKRKNCK